MKRRHSAKFWALMTVLAVIGGGALVALRFSSVGNDRQRVAALRAETQDEELVQGQLAHSQKELDLARLKLQHLEQGIPTTAYIPTLLFELEKIGKDSGIKVIGVRPMPKPPQSAVAKQAGAESTEVSRPAYEELNIEVKGRGNYASVMRFVDALRSFPKIVAARTVTVTPGLDPKNAINGQLEVAVELRAYLFPQTKAKETPAKEVASA